MSVNPLSGTLSTTTGGSTGGANTDPASQLGESAFLTLLAAELQYQNPLQPMDNTQFVAELAQFSQLSAVTQQTSTLNQILSALTGGGNSLVQASQLIGKTVTTQNGQSGQVTAVNSGSQGLSLDVQGVGTVSVSDITGVSS